MFEVFERYIAERALLTGKELGLIQSLAAEKKIARRELILTEGEIFSKAIFITKGLLRLYRTDDKGNEYILRFGLENGWISDRESYLTGKSSNANIGAIENSEILIWEKKDFRFLLTEIPAFKQLMKNLVEKSQIANQNRIYASISSSAEEKYLQFIAKNPATFNRIPLHMVASYLGVSRETLSRIRRHSVNK